MKTYTLEIELLSDAIPGSGEGFGAVIDADVVFNDVGIPFIPAKRIKGCLRESANDVCAMLEASEITTLAIDFEKEKEEEEYVFVNEIFGRQGQEKSADIYFSNFAIPGYEENVDALTYFQKEYPSIVSSEIVVQYFTYPRQSTAIDETGTADDHSLRTFRVLKKGITFAGTIRFHPGNSRVEEFLGLACLNLRRIGTRRKRGFGDVRCKLFDDKREIVANV